MRVLVTGAGGFVGTALVDRLRACAEVSMVVATDLGLPPPGPTGADGGKDAPQAPVLQIAGDLSDPGVQARLFATPVDRVFHLASIPGGMAEQQPEVAERVNLGATRALLDACARQAQAGGPVVRFVFASSIAVLGPLHAPVDDRTPLQPVLRYGHHKRTGEQWVAQAHRTGAVQGCSLRLPGVLARPPARTGQLSAFMSDLIRAVATGQRFTCPTSPQAQIWAASRPCTVDNLLHAAQAPDADLAGPEGGRAFTLPVLHLSMEALAHACGVAFGTAGAALVDWQADASLEALFGRQPALRADAAWAAGFRHDGDALALVRRSLQG